MRCMACDVRLTPREDSAKYAGTTERIGLCFNCLGEVEGDFTLPPVVNFRLPDQYDETGEDDAAPL